MLPIDHAIYGAGFALLANLFIFPGLNLVAVAVIFLSTVLIDVDHYAVYVYRHRDLSIRRAHKYFENMCENLKKAENGRAPMLVLHTVEFFALLVVLSFYSRYFAFIAAGMLFHLALDQYDLYKNNIHRKVSRSLIHHHLTKHKCVLL